MNFEKRHLHPLGMLLTAIKAVKEFSLPLLVLIVTQVLRQEISPWILTLALALVLAITAFSVLSWYRFTYSVRDGVLLVEHGVLVRNKIVIPRERIQAIDFNQGVIQRLFSLVSVQVETAGGTKPEAVLTAVARRDALELRQLLAPAATPENSDPKERAGRQKELAAGYLLLFAVTSGGGLGVVLAVFSGLWATLDDIGLEFKVIEYYHWFVEHENTVILIALLLIFLWTLTALGIILKYGGFKLTRTGDRIQVVYGLLHRRQVSLPVRRILALRLAEGMLRQPWGLVTLQVESAGYGEKSAEKALIWPLMRQKDLPDFLQEFLPEFNDKISLRPLPPGTRHKYAIRALMPSIPAAALLIPLLYQSGFAYPLLPLAIPALFTVMGLWNHRDAGWGLRGSMMAVRYRLFSRTEVIIPRRSIQSLTISHNPLQHRAGLANFELDLASKAGFGLVHISTSDGSELTRWLRATRQSSNDIRP